MKKIFYIIALCSTISISVNAQWEIGNNYNRQIVPSVKLYNETPANIEVGVASWNQAFSGQAKAGDGIIRVNGGGNLIMGLATNSTTDARSFMIASETATLLKVTTDGRVRIGNVTAPGTAVSDYRLYVEKGILTERLKVTLKSSTEWADYVFDKKYKLMSLSNVEKFIIQNKHLPNVPSADEVVSQGIDMAKMDAKLLEKIEELTLYLIQLDKKVKKLEVENQKLKEKNN